MILFTRRGGKSSVIHKHNFALSLLAPLTNWNIFQRPKLSIEASPCVSYTISSQETRFRQLTFDFTELGIPEKKYRSCSQAW